MNAPDVIVVQHAAPETPGLIAHALEARSLRLGYVRPFVGDAVPADLGDACGLVVMGGPMGVSDADRYPNLRDEMRLIEQALRDQKPVLGAMPFG